MKFKKGEMTSLAGLNKFADLTDEEIAAHTGAFKIPKNDVEKSIIGMGVPLGRKAKKRMLLIAGHRRNRRN